MFLNKILLFWSFRFRHNEFFWFFRWLLLRCFRFFFFLRSNFWVLLFNFFYLNFLRYFWFFLGPIDGGKNNFDKRFNINKQIIHFTCVPILFINKALYISRDTLKEHFHIRIICPKSENMVDSFRHLF